MYIITLFLKGILIGIGKIVPGISGALIAISLNVYEESINRISNIFKNFKENLIFLIPIGIGVALSIAFFSKIILYFLNNYFFSTMLLFIGLIIGNIFTVIKEVNIKNKINLAIVLISLLIFLFITNLNNFNNNVETSFFILMMIGLIEAMTIVIPGISGTAVLMSLGYYDIFLNIISNITNFIFIKNNILSIIAIVAGLFIGIVITAKAISYLFKNYKEKTYCVILGCVFSSIMSMFSTTLSNSCSVSQIITGLFVFFIGYKLSKKFS